MLIHLFAISDGTAETVVNLARAAQVQFETSDRIIIERFSGIADQESIELILQKAKVSQAVIAATLVNPQLRVYLVSRASQLGIHVIDVLFPLLEVLTQRLGHGPQAVPGLLRRLDDDYFKRIRAIEYTVQHDDGMSTAHLHEADVVLLGVSRTSKTPLSMYLASAKSYKVANIPLIPSIPLPPEIATINQRRVVGLVIDPERLSEIRTARMKECGHDSVGNYSDLEKIYEELEWSRSLFRKNRLWRTVDVTGKALEETAVEIERLLGVI